VIIERAEEEVMDAVPLVAPAAAALKVVEVKPQEDMTSSMSGESRQQSIRMVVKTNQAIRPLTILIIGIVAIPVGIKLAHASRALGQLRACALCVANAVDLLPVAVEVLVAGAGCVDHGLADGAALRGHVVVVEFLREDGAGEAEEEDGGFVVHACGLELDMLLGW
jgi:fumarate reductase subunit D